MAVDDLPVALVLGARVLPDGRPSPALRRRAVHAVSLWRDGRVRALILSGGVRTNPPAEALVMAQVCRAAGVPETALVLETGALTTEDNFRLSRPLLEALGARKVVVVTDRYHAARARLMGRRAGFDVVVDSPDLKGAPPLRVARTWLREMAALFWYWIRGAGR
ncbi:YdcF family protein [Antarctobacter jejuensis]|uniref:YdcF family protein n=1 Tax=Antarctobacter jejuensis TaxID=1439938 RepID=UPI003FD4735A